MLPLVTATLAFIYFATNILLGSLLGVWDSN